LSINKSTKVFGFYLFLCGFVITPANQQKPQAAPYGPPMQVAILKDKSIDESSGLVASRLNPGTYWTHNDDGAFIFALNSRGAPLGVFRVTGAQARDWEDISIGPGPDRDKSYLYIGDIGDNDAVRSEIAVYRVAEPAISPATANFSKKQPGATESAEAIRLSYPDGKFDAETLLVHPTTGNIYVITKVPLVNPVVYEAAAPFTPGKLTTMRRIGEIHVPSVFGGVLTGGSVSPDGRRVALCDYFQGYELELPAKSTDFNDIWKQKMIGFDLGKREQGEAIAYRADGRALLATSEGKGSPLFQVTRN
jgi:hypothetical protein